MTGYEHYQAAEQHLAAAKSRHVSVYEAQQHTRLAAVHAALAQAAAAAGMWDREPQTAAA